MSSLLNRYAAFLSRQPVLVFLLACALTAGSGFFASHLELRSNFEELLPDSYRSVQDLHRLVGRVGGLGNLVVAVECDDLKASERFAEDLVPRLKQNLPPNYVRYVEYKVDEQKEFYEKNKYLYADLIDLQEIRDRVREHIEEEKWKRSPLAVDLGLEDEADTQAKFDLSDIEQKYEKKRSKLEKYPDGYFVGEEGRLLAILVKPYGTATGIDFSRKLAKAVEKEIADLHPSSYHPSMKVGLTGKYRTNIDQYQSLTDDIVSTTAFTVMLVILSVYAFYRTAGAFVCLGIAVSMGVAWTFALAYWHIGYLNSQTAFLASIIVGNGINYGLIFMARYQEERRAGVATLEALASSIRNTIQATATASLATCVSFGALMATAFKGFNQFGFIGGFGMALCWLASFTVLPVCVVLYERIFLKQKGWGGAPPRRPLVGAGVAWAICRWVVYLDYAETTAVALAVGLVVWGVQWRWRRQGIHSTQGVIVGPSAYLVEHHPRILAVLSAAMVLASVGLIIWFIPNSFEYDFSKLLQKSRQKTQAELLKTRVNAVFGESLSPVVIVADRLDQVEAIQREVLRKRDAEPADDRIIDTCKTLVASLPRDQEQKMAVLGELRVLLEDQTIALLPDSLRQKVEQIRSEIAQLKPIGLDELPPMMTHNYEELDGKKGLIVYVFPRPGAGLWDGRRVIRFAQSVRTTALPSGETIYTSGEPVIFADMLEAVAHDAPRAAAGSVLGVLLLLLISFRNLKASLVVMASLLAGVVMMGGGMALFDIKLNFFNFVVIPITIGIGVDYAVNIYQRYRLEGPGSVGFVIRRSGGAVALCSLTTIIGYCALIIAQNAALTSFGWMANVGEFACLFTAILSMPAFLLLIERRRARRAGKSGYANAAGS
ncbi:MAG: MMPL family transporter [Candidatus Latescibacteria bacterium]|nr:MMPL family transporter [Candidatus Latescibacterota bacterium]